VKSAERTPGGIAISVKHISKTFPGVQALSDVSLSCSTHEIHAIVGENGAGKSTLIQIMGGVQRPDHGSVEIASPLDATVKRPSLRGTAVGIVYQELSLTPQLSVAENILVDHPPSRFGFSRRNASIETAREALEYVGAGAIDPRQRVSRLSAASRQLVEIAKAVVGRPKVLILDEPASSLSIIERETLFALLRRLRDAGTCVVMISHHLNDVIELADSVSVLRDGELVFESPVSDVTADLLASRMVGREVSAHHMREPSSHPIGAEILRVEGLSATGLFDDIAFNLRSGEIVGMAGLIGSGRTEVALAIVGATQPNAGTVVFKGEEVRFRTPVEAIRRGIVYATEDRHHDGLFVDLSILDHFSLYPMLMGSPWGLTQPKVLRERALNWCETMRVRTPSVNQSVNKLSGGNQQKVLLGSWIATHPAVLIVDEPTRGVDIGARHEIYATIRELAKGGVGVLLISSDLLEILALSDRIVVMSDGRISGELDGDGATEEIIMQLAAEIPSRSPAIVSGDSKTVREKE